MFAVNRFSKVEFLEKTYKAHIGFLQSLCSRGVQTQEKILNNSTPHRI